MCCEGLGVHFTATVELGRVAGVDKDDPRLLENGVCAGAGVTAGAALTIAGAGGACSGTVAAIAATGGRTGVVLLFCKTEQAA